MNENNRRRRHPFIGFLVTVFVVGLLGGGVYLLVKNLSHGPTDSDSSGDSTSNPITYHVVFAMNGYHTLDDIVVYVNEHETVNDPQVNRLGYDLTWCSDQLGTLPWDFGNTIENHLTLYAHWTLLEYQVSFDLNDGGGTTPQTQNTNYLTYDEIDGVTSKLTRPSEVDLAKNGYVLDGWWLEDTEGHFTAEWNFDADLVFNDMTLHAGWGVEKTVDHFTIIEYEDAVKITDYDNTIVDGTLIIPDTILGKNVLSIGKDAFRSFHDADNIVLPAHLTTINESAFYNALAVYDLTIPDSVTSIGKMAFHSCATLYELQLGTGVRNIGAMSFYQCTSLGINDQISIPGNVISIEEQAFNIVAASKPFDDVVFQEGLEFIGREAFAHLNAATITLPDSLQHISREAFIYTYQLGEIHLGKGLVYIGYDAFYYAQKEDAPGYLHVYIAAIEPPLLGGATAFGVFTINAGVPSRSNFFIIVPQESLDAYKEDENWGLYYSTRIVYFLIT